MPPERERRNQFTIYPKERTGVPNSKMYCVTATSVPRLSWRWIVEELPSRLPEDQLTSHDYLSIAAEFDDGPAILKLDTLSSITLWGNLLNQFDFVEGMRARSFPNAHRAI